MAQTSWATVYYQDMLAGILEQRPSSIYAFTYDSAYIKDNNPPICHAMPVTDTAYINSNGLHPFFDNLVSEGWLASVQKGIIKNRQPSQFEKLLAFGYDCPGAVSVIDPNNPPQSKHYGISTRDMPQERTHGTTASLSGVQKKNGCGARWTKIL